MKYMYEKRFEDRMRFEDNKGRVWDSEDLNEFASWELDGMGLHVADEA